MYTFLVSFYGSQQLTRNETIAFVVFMFVMLVLGGAKYWWPWAKRVFGKKEEE